MVLTCTVSIIDNSGYCLNGDWKPNRLEAQLSAVRSLASRVIQDNTESSISLMTLSNPQVIITPTVDTGMFLKATFEVTPKEDPDVRKAVQIAMLELRHRPNKTARQRIVLFVGSPLLVDSKELVKVGKELRKNNISLDIVLFSDHETNSESLQLFIENVKKSSGESCDFVDMYSDKSLGNFNEAFRKTIIYNLGVAPNNAPAAGGADELMIDVDPDLDPDLYLAMRLSMEDQRDRERREAEAAAANTGPEGGAEAAADEEALEEENTTNETNPEVPHNKETPPQ